MPRRPRHLPPDILPPDFIEQHDLIHRLYAAPTYTLTPPHPWAPLTDAEWAFLAPLLPGTAAAAGTAGRPMADARARLDAVLRLVTLKRPAAEGGGPSPWRALPAAFGKPDTASRTLRRWAEAGLWERLLRLVADVRPGGRGRRAEKPSALLLGLRWRIRCAWRRASRRLGLRGIVLARRLGLYSALRAPSAFLPDPDLSKTYVPVITRAVNRVLESLAPTEQGAWVAGWKPPKPAWRLLRSMLTMAGGRTRIARAMCPP